MVSKHAPRNFLLLHPYYDTLQLLQTRPFDYSALAKQGAAVGGIPPEFLTELTFRRGAVSTWLQSLSTTGAPNGAPVPDVVLQEVSALAARLHGLTLAAAALPLGPAAGAAADTRSSDGAASAAAFSAAASATMGQVRPEWTSALSKKPQRFLRLDCLPQELAMVYATYAAALRHSALQRCSVAVTSGSGEADPPEGPVPTGATDASATAATATAAAEGGGGGGEGQSVASGLPAVLTAAVAGLRRAAGVYEFLEEGLLPAVAGSALAAGTDRPLELLPAAARLLKHLCLAEGQALVAAAAAVRGMSPGTQRALHAGCATLYRQAAATAQELAGAAPAGLPPSDRLLRLLPAAAALHTGRAALCLARDRQAAMELGESEAACEECRRLLDGAVRGVDRRSDPPAWLSVIEAEQQVCSELKAAMQRDRLSVTFQPVPRTAPDAAAEPAVRVAPEAFRPEPVMPPVPPPAAARAGGACHIM